MSHPTRKQLAVLGVVAAAVFRDGAFPTADDLAKRLGLHVWTVKTHMAALRARGFVTSRTTVGHVGKITASGWRVLVQHGWEPPRERWCAFANAVVAFTGGKPPTC